MSSLKYIYLKLIALLFRALVRLGGRITAHPDEVYHIPSRDGARTIKAHVYKSTTSPQKPSPVLINFHGSGFILPAHGSDDEFCRQVSRETEYTVLDVQYRLAPEHPFPAAFNDAEDAVNHVLARPQEYDLANLAISGFSAGGNLALGASSSFPRDTFRCVLAIYPALDIYTDPAAKKPPPNPAGKPIPALVARFFNRCYVPKGFDARDPRVSPCYADPRTFPHRVLIVTADCDTLALEAEELARKIQVLPGRRVVWERMEGCDHAWDKRAEKGTPQGDAKERTYALAVEMLRL